MVRDITGAAEPEAAAALAAAGGRVKPAVVALLAGVDAAAADRLLADASGRVRDAIAAAANPL
jgi:N-acetylmuramic acid 6-phosphate etherase